RAGRLVRLRTADRRPARPPRRRGPRSLSPTALGGSRGSRSDFARSGLDGLLHLLRGHGAIHRYGSEASLVRVDDVAALDGAGDVALVVLERGAVDQLRVDDERIAPRVPHRGVGAERLRVFLDGGRFSALPPEQPPEPEPRGRKPRLPLDGLLVRRDRGSRLALRLAEEPEVVIGDEVALVEPGGDLVLLGRLLREVASREQISEVVVQVRVAGRLDDALLLLGDLVVERISGDEVLPVERSRRRLLRRGRGD